MTYISVDVDVDIDMFDDDELVEYLEQRGYTCIKNCTDSSILTTPQIEDALNELYQQYRNGNPNLMESLRTYLMNATGRVLP